MVASALAWAVNSYSVSRAPIRSGGAGANGPSMSRVSGPGPVAASNRPALARALYLAPVGGSEAVHRVARLMRRGQEAGGFAGLVSQAPHRSPAVGGLAARTPARVGVARRPVHSARSPAAAAVGVNCSWLLVVTWSSACAMPSQRTRACPAASAAAGNGGPGLPREARCWGSEGAEQQFAVAAGERVRGGDLPQGAHGHPGWPRRLRSREPGGVPRPLRGVDDRLGQAADRPGWRLPAAGAGSELTGTARSSSRSRSPAEGPRAGPGGWRCP